MLEKSKFLGTSNCVLSENIHTPPPIEAILVVRPLDPLEIPIKLHTSIDTCIFGLTTPHLPPHRKNQALLCGEREEYCYFLELVQYLGEFKHFHCNSCSDNRFI